VWQAAKAIASTWPEIFTVGFCALSGVPLMLGCIDIAPIESLQFYVLAFVPIGIYVAAVTWMLARARRWRSIHIRGANAIFLLLGTLTFATVLALGLLIHRGGDYTDALRRVSFPLSLGGLPALATGMLIWHRVTRKRLINIRIAGTSIAIFGAAILLGALVIAWPDPRAILHIALFDFVLLTFIALLYDVPQAHWLALPCCTIAWVLGFHLLRTPALGAKNAGQLIDALSDPLGASSLTALVMLFAAAREILKRFRQTSDAKIYGEFATVIAVACVAWLTWAGFGRSPDVYGCTWVYAIYAVIAFVIAWRAKSTAWSWVAWILAAGALVQAFTAHHLTRHPWAESLLTFATIAATLHFFTNSASTRRRSLRYSEEPDHSPLDPALRSTSETGVGALRRNSVAHLLYPSQWLTIAAAALAFLISLATLPSEITGRIAFNVGWASILFLGIALLDGTLELFIIGQLALATAVVVAAISRIVPLPWFAQSEMPWLEPWTIQVVAISLACVSIFWKAVRRFPIYPRRMTGMLAQAAPLDRGLSVALLAVLLALSLLPVVPGIGVEFHQFAPANFQPQQLRAIGAGAWIMLGLIAVGMALDAWEQATVLLAIALPVTFWIACPLLAGRLALQGESASALRWLCAGYCVIGLPGLWIIRSFSGLAREARGAASKNASADEARTADDHAPPASAKADPPKFKHVVESPNVAIIRGTIFTLAAAPIFLLTLIAVSISLTAGLAAFIRHSPVSARNRFGH
jgi:hypothetical protein